MGIIHGTLHIIATIGVIIIGDITDLFGALLIMVVTIIVGLTTTHTDMVMAIIDIMETMGVMAPITDTMAIEVITATKVLPIAQVEEVLAIQEEV